MKVVIDTNVIVSAALKDRDSEAVILFVVEQPEFEWVISSAILEEYQAVLRREKFGLPEELLRKWDEMFDALTVSVEVDVEIDFPRDKKDAKFLECALVADAEYLITGDKDFTEAQKLVNTAIISVSMFKRIVMKAWS
jgi:putative PIN family toxin of toxin-antitoxin system